MDLDPSEEQRLLAASIERFVERDYAFETRRRIVASPDGYSQDVWRTMADVSLDVTIYKPPFSVPFWTGTSNDTYFDPPVGSFGLGSEDEA